MNDFKGVRIADDDIYVNGKDFGKPKEYFLLLAKLIESLKLKNSNTIFDVGCASGAFINFLKMRFPNLEYTGMDISEKLIKQATNDVGGCHFLVGSALELDAFPTEKFDVINCSGVLAIFDEIRTPLRNLISRISPGGSLFINTPINEEPIDVIMRYQRTDINNEGPWESGWNIFSKQTYERTLYDLSSKINITWHPFDMPFPIEKVSDPMRTWTISTSDKPNQTVNGACQLLNHQIIQIVINK
jgi:trans-aconitate methyltransferase